MKAVVFTLGCKVNEVESASVVAALENAGMEVYDKLCEADIYVLNTCAVTREAERKSRQLVARARKFNPSAPIYVCGCACEKDKNSFLNKGVKFVCGARDKEKILSAISADFSCPFDGLPYPRQLKTRAFVKIQDGCNNFCSYCVIPYLRGRERSRPVSDILREISAVDCPEIVLNGLNISSYNDDGRGLKDLLAALADEDKRIRLGSLECSVITEEFLAAARRLKNFAPQFHLSLQSGSTAVLKAMNRRYTREQYLGKCDLIYSYFPSAAITTDIICGFPSETEEDFGQSLSMIEEAGFARVHAFSFSPREGTAAFAMKNLPEDVKSSRLKRLLAAADRAEKKYISAFLGKTLSFIAEEEKDGHTVGYTGNYIKIYAPAAIEKGVGYNVKLTEAYADGALAEIIRS